MAACCSQLERYVAMDCEMVRCRTRQALARVALVDYKGVVVFHSYVFVNPANVVDYQTKASGITPSHLEGAPTYEVVSAHVRGLLKDKILVGHALFNDLAVLSHRHVYEDVRDTALFYPLRERMGVTREGMFPSLRTMTKEILGRDIQHGEHCPIEDARAAMDIFLSVRDAYEAGLAAGDDVVAGVPCGHAKWYW